jgi:hypothetical protein
MFIGIGICVGLVLEKADRLINKFKFEIDVYDQFLLFSFRRELFLIGMASFN